MTVQVVNLSTRLILHAEDWPNTGTPRITAATQIARMQNAVARMTVDPDDYLTADVNIWYLPAGGTGHGDTAWGKSYSGRKIHVAPGNPPGSSGYQQQATIIHEIAHKVDNDILNPTDRAAIMDLMVPVPSGSGGAQSRWSGGGYAARPSEIFAYAFVEAYSDIQNILPGYYDREIPNANFAAFRAIVNAASTPSDPPPEPDPIDPPPPDTGIPSSWGDKISVTVTPIDPDTGDKMTGAVLEAYPAGTTQAQINAGLQPTKSDQKLWVASPYPTSTTLTANNLLPANYIIRVRTRDRGNNVADQSKWEWGLWSALQTVEVRFRPGAIANLNATTDTLTPTITGNLVHEDPSATIAKVRIRLTYKDPITGTVTPMVDEWYEGSGITGGNAFAKVYSGASLSPLREYELDGQIEDSQGLIGPMQTTPVKFTIVEAIGPTNMLPRTTSVKQETRSPTLTIGHSSAFTEYEFEVATEPEGEGEVIWDRALTAVASTSSLAIPWAAPGGRVLAWGSRPSWRAAVNSGPWSEWQPFAIDALPETPLFYILDQNGNWVLLSTLTSRTMPSADSDVRFTYNDPDRATYGEVPKWRELTIYDAPQGSAAPTLRSKIVRRFYGYEDMFRIGVIEPFDKPGSLSAANSGWNNGTAATLAYTPDPAIRGHALRVTLNSLATATASNQTKSGSFALGTNYTDLSQVTTGSINIRSSANPSGLAVGLRVEFSGSSANYAEFLITPTTPGVWQEKALTLASPNSTGGTVNWAQVSGIRFRIQHSAGSNQSFVIYLDDLTFDVLELDKGYRINGRYMDQNTESVWGAPSHAGQNAIVFVSEPPVVVVATPVGSQPMPSIAWTLTRGDQASYRVETIDVATGGVIDDSGWVVSEDNSYRIPPERLRNSRQYRVTVSVLSPYDVIGFAYSAQWMTSFTQLSVLTDLELTPDATHSTVQVTFTPATSDEFWAYRLFVSYPGVERLLVSEWFDTTVGETTDYSPPTGIPLLYELTQYDGWLDSEPVSATTTIGQPAWYFAVPDDLTLSFPIYVEGSFSRSEGARMSHKQAEGRSTPISVTDVTSAPVGNFTLHVPAEDFEAVEQVRAVARKSREVPFVYLKTRFGESLRVKLGTANETYLHAGSISMPYTSVVWQPPVRGLTTADEDAVQPLLIEAVDWLSDPAPAFPPDTTLTYVATPVLSVPAYLTPFTDPTWGTEVQRIYNSINSVHTYSKRQAWNPSETKIMLGLTSGNRALLDASDYSVINAAVGGDGQWWDDDVLLRANTATGAVFLYNPSTNTNTGTIRDFSTYASGSTFNNLTQSSPSDDLRYWLFTGTTSGGQKTVICWDAIADTFTTLNVTTLPHSGSMSHSGDYLNLNWDTTGTGNEQGIWMLDRSFTRLFQVFRKKQHCDFQWDTNGNEVLVMPQNTITPEFDQNSYMYRCSDGHATVIISGVAAFRHGHVSGRNSDQPGWAIFSTYDNQTGTDKGTDQVLALKLDGSETVRVFAHSHENATSDIVGDATAVPNRLGTKVLFHSAWGVLNTSYEYIANAI